LTILRFFTCCALVASITTYSCLAFNSPIRRFDEIFSSFLYYSFEAYLELETRCLARNLLAALRELFQGFSSHEFWHARVKNKGMNTDK
jgi:hypothetical protein